VGAAMRCSPKDDRVAMAAKVPLAGR